MPYIQIYDIAWNEMFQAEIDAETAAKAPPGVLVSSTPWSKLPIKSRFRSERHPPEPDQQEDTT